MSGNDIAVIKQDTFRGLSQCEKLVLNKNKIHTIESGALKEMKSLNQLELEGNNLTTLSWTTFGLEHPSKLELSLSSNPLTCDSSLCWIQKGAQDHKDQWITLDNNKPECIDPDSDGISTSLNCSHLGICEYNF